MYVLVRATEMARGFLTCITVTIFNTQSLNLSQLRTLLERKESGIRK